MILSQVKTNNLMFKSNRYSIFENKNHLNQSLFQMSILRTIKGADTLLKSSKTLLN
jgi:hypothetical protein